MKSKPKKHIPFKDRPMSEYRKKVREEVEADKRKTPQDFIPEKHTPVTDTKAAGSRKLLRIEKALKQAGRFDELINIKNTLSELPTSILRYSSEYDLIQVYKIIQKHRNIVMKQIALEKVDNKNFALEAVKKSIKADLQEFIKKEMDYAVSRFFEVKEN